MSVKVRLHAKMRFGTGPERKLQLDLTDLAWSAHGLEHAGPFAPVMLDLIEIARVVHEFDRRQPKRTSKVRVESVAVEMPVREPAQWNRAATNALTNLLRIQGNAEWTFEFRPRGSRKTLLDMVVSPSAKPKAETKAVILFSGGLDSTSGLATIRRDQKAYLLASYYSGNLKKQRQIAAKLGFSRHLQITSNWRREESNSGSGGMFWYRGLLFLSIAAAIAHSVGAAKILQFENGPLALCVAALPIYRMTRHAHPIVHREMAKLVEALTGTKMRIENPFLDKTKAEAVAMLRAALPPKEFKEVVALTESCWYLKATAIVAGPKKKDVGQPCGACIPCLVRRSAVLAAEDIQAGVNFARRNDNLARDPVVRVHFECYSGFADQLLDSRYTAHDFVDDCPSVTQDFLDGGAMTVDEAFDLYRRFARDWKKAFA